MRGPLLFSVTTKDFIMQTFKVGGNGGQKVNKTNSGCRLIHPPSGARGEGREERSFDRNRKSAFNKLVNTDQFKVWHKLETAKRLGRELDVESKVNDMMKEKNLKTEFKVDGKWSEEV